MTFLLASAVAGVFTLILLASVVFGLAIYFIPSIIAFQRNRPNKMPILVLNIFLGWSLVGWVVSLVWALSNDTNLAPNQMIVHHTYEQPGMQPGPTASAAAEAPQPPATLG